MAIIAEQGLLKDHKAFYDSFFTGSFIIMNHLNSNEVKQEIKLIESDYLVSA